MAMRLRVIAVGQRMPGWVNEAWRDYVMRLPRGLQPELTEIPLGSRSGRNADMVRAKQAEGERVLKALPKQGRVVALDERGDAWSSLQLAAQLADWQQQGEDVSLLIGGPDGHDAQVLQRAQGLWSLSRLTLPHAMVRVLLAEQLYRAWTLNTGHPYHRE